MTEGELFQPSLKEGWKKTKTYNINLLFLVAFFGGTIPMLILGTRNAKWLNISKKRTNLLIALGVILTVLNLVFLYLYAQDTFSPEINQMLRLGFRFAAIILFFAYKFFLNDSFKQHLVIDGGITPILKPALLCILAAGLIDFIVLFLAVL